MATLVLLGGNDIKNKERIHEMDQTLLPFYDKTRIRTYRHRDEGGNMDFEHECDNLCKYLNTLQGSVILFCKSFGCLIALKAIAEKEMFIKQCIFVGFPLGYCEKTGFPRKAYLKECTSPIVFIQKTGDPAGGYATIEKEIGSISPAFTCKEIPGETHDYTEISVIKEIILDNNAT